MGPNQTKPRRSTVWQATQRYLQCHFLSAPLRQATDTTHFTYSAGPKSLSIDNAVLGQLLKHVIHLD